MQHKHPPEPRVTDWWQHVSAFQSDQKRTACYFSSRGIIPVAHQLQTEQNVRGWSRAALLMVMLGFLSQKRKVAQLRSLSGCTEFNLEDLLIQAAPQQRPVDRPWLGSGLAEPWSNGPLHKGFLNQQEKTNKTWTKLCAAACEEFISRGKELRRPTFKENGPNVILLKVILWKCSLT